DLARSIRSALPVNVGTCRAMGLGLRLPFCLLLLLLVSLGSAQGRSTVFLDIQEEARGPGQIINDQLTLSKIPVRVERGSPLCPACEKFTDEALSYLSQKQSQDKMMEVLHEACSQTFSLEKKCVEFVDSYATLLFAKIAEIKPEEFCKRNGLCRDNALLSGVRSESTCVFCHHLMDEVLSKLKDPDAEFEIIQILLKECKKIEGHEQQCKRLVLQYIPLILVNGEKFLEKNDICTIVQACDAGKKTMVGPFSEEGLLRDA
uniref:Saposin B-type domain-containing protein n=1 Tax=Aegilops tauschii subsp. strangulata TaxID=200361 RepID=A0A453HNI0_AEGTS